MRVAHSGYCMFLVSILPRMTISSSAIRALMEEEEEEADVESIY
jgi:hypothetical protein